jgi:hypothetical protein
MLNKEQTKKEVLINIVKTSYPIVPLGGQVCGVARGISLYSPDLDIEIKINYFNSQYKNLELANVLINLVIDDIIK